MFCQLAIRGTVLNENNLPITSASVLLKKNDSTIVGYSITDKLGNYTITTSTTQINNSVQVNALGYASQTKIINNTTTLINFTLSPSEKALPNIIVKGNLPIVSTNGDTINYNVASFSNKTDRVIGDVLKKIPGIEVDAKGKISYNGKAISNFYIDGDDLLDDKYNIATNSLPTEAVEKVQVLENHQPIKILKNSNKTNDVAINLKIKDKAKIKTIGTADVGLGIAKNLIYNENVNAISLKKQYKAINTIKINNSGENISTDLTAQNFTAFLKRLDNIAAPQNLLSLNSIQLPNITEERYLFNNSLLINTNNLFKNKKGVVFKTNIYWLTDKITQANTVNTSYYLPTDTILFLEDLNTTKKKSTLHVELTSTVNNEKRYTKNILLIEKREMPSFANINFNNTISLQNLWQKNFAVSNEFSIIKKLKKNIIADVYSYLSLQNKQEDVTFTSGILPEVFNNNISYQKTLQTLTTPSFTTNNYLNLRTAKAKWLHNYKIGISGTSQKLQSAIDLLQQNNLTTTATDSFINNTKWSQYKAYIVPEFEKNTNKLNINFSLPLNYQHFYWVNSYYKKDFCYLYTIPSLRIKYITNQNNFFTLRLGTDRNFGTIGNAFTGFILQNFKTLTNNSFFITNKKIINSSLSYNFSIPIKLFFANAALNYSNITSNNINELSFNNNFVKTSSIYFNNQTHSVLLLGGISKYIFKLRTSVGLKINLQQSNVNQLQNKVLFKFINNSSSTDFTINSKISQKANSNYSILLFNSASRNIIGNQNSVQIPKQRFQQLRQQLSLNITLINNLYFKYKAEHLLVKQKSTSNYFFSDVSFFYALPKKHLDVVFSINNILNTRTFISNNVDAFLATQNLFYVRPRQAFISTSFTF